MKLDLDALRLNAETRHFALLLSPLPDSDGKSTVHALKSALFPEEANRRSKRATASEDLAIQLQFMGRRITPERVLSKILAAEKDSLVCYNLTPPVYSISAPRASQQRRLLRWLTEAWPLGYTIFFDRACTWCVTQHHDDWWVHVKPAR